MKEIRIETADCGFEREKLIQPFGFKGGYLTELWQTACALGTAGKKHIGLATQSALYGDADLFASHSEHEGNAKMFAVTQHALELAKKTCFRSPVDLLESILPELEVAAQKITGRTNLNINFIFNALVSLDNAAWLFYASENDFKDFDEMVPDPFKPAFAARSSKVGVMFQVSYGMPEKQILEAVDKGYFIIKIKTGQPGNQDEMLEKDKLRIARIHHLLKDRLTDQTADGKLIYTLDSNGRYAKKETLLKLLDYADEIGALSQILFVEEPLSETNRENLADIGVKMAADESIKTEADAIEKLDQGYEVIVLKGVAKTLSLSMKIAKLAFERNIPCVCADLTVNPILIDWNKNLAARLQPFPGLKMGMLETNGDANYQNWQAMQRYHPFAGASWTEVRNGCFELDGGFFAQSGGIFEPSAHYLEMFGRLG